MTCRDILVVYFRLGTEDLEDRRLLEDSKVYCHCYAGKLFSAKTSNLIRFLSI